MKEVILCASRCAVEEARANLKTEAQKSRLSRLLWRVELFDAEPGAIVEGIQLPEKDLPILLAAIEARATHLITGDRQHFGSYYGKRVAGILICSVAGYLKRRR